MTERSDTASGAIASTLAAPAGPVADLLALTARLAELVETENGILRSRRPREIEGLMDQKSRLSVAYAREMTALRARPDVIRKAPDDLRAELNRTTARLREALGTQHGLLTTARRVTEGLVQAIGREVTARARPVLGYGANAAARHATGARSASFALDTNI